MSSEMFRQTMELRFNCAGQLEQLWAGDRGGEDWKPIKCQEHDWETAEKPTLGDHDLLLWSKCKRCGAHGA